ncbi:Homeobox-DDT domain protein RLT1, partial [Mucuna pruriens]
MNLGFGSNGSHFSENLGKKLASLTPKLAEKREIHHNTSQPWKFQSEENKLSMEKNKKRRLKTPAQLMALENFYNDHKYLTEEMKSELADELELTEKQISGWFCHRRLKDKKLLNDEVCANGRQDRSSGVIQDRGSGLGQDSCGSTKHGDYRHLDPKEVESHGLYNHEFSAADMNYGHRNHHYTENDSATDSTSSESSSSLQDRSLPQGKDPYDMEPSSHLTPNGSLPPLNPKGANNMVYKPSGYLKVKGEIEHAAITAVKKQLGSHYREDGPLLTVEFDTIPPEAFECQIPDLANEAYHVANPALPNSPEVSAVKKQSSLSSRHDSYLTKLSSQDSHMEGGDFGSLHDSDFQDKKPHQNINQRPTFHSSINPLPRKNSSLDLYVDSTGEASAYNSTKNRRIGTKRGFEGMRCDSASNPSDHYEENNFAVKQTDSLLHAFDNSNLKNVRSSEYVKSKPSKSIHKSQIYLDTEERRLNKKMAKEEKFNGDRKVKKQYRDPDGVRVLSNEMMVAKRAKVDPLEQYDVKQAPVAELVPRKSQRSAAEMPSSFSEDETAETSSSMD